jgi:triosephosphate isomerase (TIM)
MSAGWPRPLVAGNWKMHGLKSSVQVLNEIAEGYTPELKAKVDLLVCPPATLMHAFALQGQVIIGHRQLGARLGGEGRDG